MRYKGQKCRVLWERDGESSIVMMSGRDMGRQMIVPSADIQIPPSPPEELKALSTEELLERAEALRRGRQTARADWALKRLRKAQKAPTHTSALRLPHSEVQRILDAGGESAKRMRQMLKQGKVISV